MKQLVYSSKKILRKINQNKINVTVLAAVAWQLVFPSGHALLAMQIPPMIYQPIAEEAAVPVEPAVEVLYTQKVAMTAYSSTPDQTDSTPCITANGYDLCKHNEENMVAANFLKFGTKMRIPELYGDKIFTVQDRMNKRYYYRVDIWMKTRQDALKFGIKNATIEVIK